MPGLNQLACLPTEPRNKAKEADWRGKLTRQKRLQRRTSPLIKIESASSSCSTAISIDKVFNPLALITYMTVALYSSRATLLWSPPSTIRACADHNASTASPRRSERTAGTPATGTHCASHDLPGKVHRPDLRYVSRKLHQLLQRLCGRSTTRHCVKHHLSRRKCGNTNPHLGPYPRPQRQCQ